MKKLYKVKVEVDIMVIAGDRDIAIEVAKKNAHNEVSVYGRGTAIEAKSMGDIPDDWKDNIPYPSNGITESRKCKDIVFENPKTQDDDMEEIIRIKEGAKNSVEVKAEISPETRPDPKPKNLDWKETQSGRPLLRFIK